LYYVPYTDKEGKEWVTVALDPEGCQRVEGELLMFEDSVSNRALAESDDKEFNFCDQSTNAKKDRVFIRTVTTCQTLTGETILAWAYVYVSFTEDQKPTVLVNVDPTKYATVRYRKIDIAEYKELFNQVHLLKQIKPSLNE